MLEAKEYNAQFEQTPLPNITADSFKVPNTYSGVSNFQTVPSVPGQGDSQYDGYITREEVLNPELLYQNRAEKQPWYDQAASFLNQAVVGEVVGGTLMSLGAIIEAPQMIMNAIDGTEQEFSNGLYELGDSISQWSKDVTPIYQTGERFGDSGWWFQNGVSVASTLSMMIPGMGASKAVGALSKILKLGTTATRLAQTGIGALTMRHAENFREAHDVFNTIYNAGIENDRSHEISLKAASDAASMDYQANYANLAFDIIQMGSILRPFANLTRNVGVSGKIASAADDLLSVPKYTPTSKVGKLINRIKDPARIGLSEWTEGIEEGINTVSQFEATRQGRIDLGLEKDDNSGFSDRLLGYLGTEEMQDSMLWGMVGGVAFKGLAQATGFDENAGITKNKLAELASRGEKLNHYAKVINAITNSSVVTAPNGEILQDYTKVKPDEKVALLADVKESMIQDLAFNAAKAGNIDILIEQVKDPKFIESLASAGVGTKEDLTRDIPNLVSKIEKYESIYAKHYTNLFESPIDTRAKSILVDRFANIESILLRNEDALKEINIAKNDLLANDAWYQAQANKEDVNIAIESFSLMAAKKSLTDALQDKNIQESTRKAGEKAIANIDKRISSVKATTKPVNITAIDKRIISNAAEAIEIQEFNNGLSEVLTELANPENVAKEAKEIKKATDELVKTLNNNKITAENNKATAERKESTAKVEEATEPVVETGEEPSVEDFPEVVEAAEEVKPLATAQLEFDPTPLGELLDKTTVEEKVSDAEAKIRKDWEEALSKSTEYKWPGKEHSTIPEEEWDNVVRMDINAKYQALLDALPTSNETSQATVEKVVEKSIFEDGNNKEVNPKEVEVEESSKLVDKDSLKRNIGLAINYLVSKFTAKGTNLAKQIINIKESNPDALVASEWKEFNPGTKVVLSLDTSFEGEVYQYVGEKDSSDIEAKKADIEKRRKEELNNYFSLQSLKESAAKIFKNKYNFQPETVTLGLYSKNTGDNIEDLKYLNRKDADRIISSSKHPDKTGYVTDKRLITEIKEGAFGISNKEINAKYDAELAALEAKPAETSKTSRVLKDGSPEVYQRTFNQIFTEDKINSPIKIQVERDGNLVTVGYLPTMGWLQSVDEEGNYENLSNNEAYPAAEQIEAVRKVRESIVNGELDKTYDFIITEKGLGKLAITTERDSNNKKVLDTVTNAMPNLITSEHFGGTVQPFTIFNQEFYVNKESQFSGVVAVSNATMEALREKGAGSVFMMIPTAKPGIFIPTPVAVPLVPENMATMMSDVVSAAAFGDNTELLNKIRFNYGINITSRRELKEFLEKFLYFTSPDEVNKTHGDGRIRMAFDTQNSLIIVNNGDGKAAYRVALNTAKSRPEELETSIRKFKNSLTNAKLSIKLNQINSTEGFAVPVIAENGDINFEESTYNKFLADNIKTDLVELTTANGNPVYVVQPVIQIEESITPEESKPKPSDEELAKDLEDIDLSDFNIEDELVGVDELISAEQVEIIKSNATNFLVKDGEYIYSSENQRVVTQTIATEVYTQFLDYDKQGKVLPVNVAFANAKNILQNRLTGTIDKLIALGETKVNMAIADPKLNLGWIGNYQNLLLIKQEYERLLKDGVWQQFEREVVSDLQNLGINVKNGKPEDIDSTEGKDITEGLEEGVLEGNEGQFEKSFSDFATFQMDSKDTASWRVKLALSTIKSGERNFLGTAEYLPFDTVFDDLQNTLSGVEADIDSTLEVLRDVAKNNPAKKYVKSIVRLLENSETEWSLKNNFISVMRRAHNEFLLTKWKRGENGWTLNVIESNRNNVVNKIIESWNENFKVAGLDSGLIEIKSGEAIVNKTKANELLTELKGLSGFEQKKNFADKLFDMLGIDLPDAARNALFNTAITSTGVYTFGLKGSFEQQFDFTKDGKPNGLFSFIVTSLAADTSTESLSEDVDKLSLNNPFTGENSEKSVKFLANLASKYGLKLDTNTFRNVESKQIYQYSFYTPERIEVEKLNKDAAHRAAKGKAPFSSTEVSRYLRLLNAGRTLEYSHVDGISQVQSSKSGVTRSNMSNREQLLLAVSQFQKHNLVAGYIGLTHSDKTITPVIDFEKIKVSLGLPEEFDGIITPDMLKTRELVNAIKELVLAEVSRISKIRELKAQNNDNLTELKKSLGAQYYDGAEYFYFFPELNALVRDAEGNLMPAALNNIDALVNAVFETTIVPTINDTIQEFLNTGIVYEGTDKQKGKWFTMFKEGYVKDVGYGRDNGKEGLSNNEVMKLAAIAAADMDINYIIHNANMMMLVHGDPALEYKKNVDTTLVEYQKRLAKDVAPGALGHYNWSMQSGDNQYTGNKYYNVVFVNDINNSTETEGYIRNLPSYTGDIDRTDAQEWSTVEEHLNVLMSYGRISDTMYKRMMDKITTAKNNGTYDYEFTDEELAIVLQPMKPVQVMSIFDPITGLESSYYIKSSSYPLIPSLTKGLDLDKVRVAMERDGVNRLAFKTSTKIGHRKLVTIADVNGNILDDINFKGSEVQLSREGFSIQQDVPYEEGKHRIVTISQMNKLLFEGISDLDFGNGVKGIDLKQRKEAIRTKLFELSAKELYGRMGIEIVDGAPIVADKQRLMASVKEEAVKRGWAINDIESLGIDEEGNFVIPLSFNNSASRVESLILSMFTNTIIKQKINGKSMVQGTSSGFKNNVKTLDEIKDQSGIVFVKDKFNPAKGLTYLTLDGDKVQRAQVLIPWKFAGELENFVTDGYLDMDKISPELLYLIGARIPNQGHSSQLAVEVVGFLPHSMGDLIIVPGEITKQMGSDFDVDKLYTYIYNNTITDEGKLIKIPNLLDKDFNLDDSKYRKFLNKNFSTQLNNRQKVKYYLDNKLEEYEKIGGLLGDVFEQDLDIPAKNLVRQEVLKDLELTEEDLTLPTKSDLYRMALENVYIDIHNQVLTHPEVAKKCLQELDQKDLEITGKVGRKKSTVNNYLTVRRQLNDYMRQKAGKDGVGVMSRAVVGATVIQDYNLRVTTVGANKEVIDNPFRGFSDDNGNVLALVRLSGVGTSTFNGKKRTKVGNLIIQQSGAVDNAKTPVLDMNNLNMQTFNASIAISLLQTDGGKALDLRYNSYFLKQEIIMDYIAELANLSDTLNSEFVSNKKDLIIERLADKYIKRAGITSYKTVGKSYTANDLESLLITDNTNSPEYVKDQLEILEHFLTLDAIGQELSEIFTAISTDSKGLGKSYWESSLRQEQIEKLGNKSIISGAEELMVNSENGTIAKYVTEANTVMSQLFPYTTQTVDYIVKEIERMTGKNERVDVDFRQIIWDSYRRFLMSTPSLDVVGDRQELFYGENSVAKQVDKAKATWGKNNLFIMKLRPVKATKQGNPDLVTFAASLAERTDEAEVIKAFTDLFISSNPETRQFAEDLVKYAYTTGGVQQALEYLKYIPVAYLTTTNFTETIETVLEIGKYELVNADRFIEQFFQHNPNYPKKITSFTPDKKGFTLDVEKNSDLLEEVMTPEGKQLQFPNYLTYRDGKVWALYKNIGGGKFRRISLLGGKGKDLTSYNEYDFSSDNVVSTMPNNNPNIAQEAAIEVNSTPNVATPEAPVPNPVSSEVNSKKYVNDELAGVEAVQHLANNLTEQRFRDLANILLNNSGFINNKLRIILNPNLKSTKTGNPSRGKYTSSTATVEVNPSIIATTEKLLGRGISNRAYEAALMHELLHAYTSEAYDDYKAGKEVTKEVVESFKRIEVLFNVALSKLSDADKTQLEALREYIKPKGDKSLIGADSAARAAIIDQYYGFTSVKEFISEAMTNSVFQAKLNEMQFTNKKTFLQRFLDLIKGLFEGIKENSVLEATFVEVVQLLENQNNTVVETTQEPAQYTYATEQEAALAVDNSDIKTGTIITIAGEQYKVINSENTDIQFIPINPVGDVYNGSLLVGVEDLGTTVGEYMKSLPKDERNLLRNMLNNKEITIKCR